jgi:hypothetical protein
MEKSLGVGKQAASDEIFWFFLAGVDIPLAL